VFEVSIHVFKQFSPNTWPHLMIEIGFSCSTPLSNDGSGDDEHTGEDGASDSKQIAHVDGGASLSLQGRMDAFLKGSRASRGSAL
jgi:hypothetical protein